jgi:hypothetical protein
MPPAVTTLILLCSLPPARESGTLDGISKLTADSAVGQLQSERAQCAEGTG